MDTVTMADPTDFLFIGLFLQQCQGKQAHVSQIQSTAKIKKKKKKLKGSCHFKKIFAVNFIK